MKKNLLLAIMILFAAAGMAQDKCYWVFFTDKHDTQFDPYSYFDAKAIARYQQCGADLYDISNYPLNDSYVNTVDAYASDLFGHSRWLNAVGIMATEENAALISQLPFVASVEEIESNGMVASVETATFDIEEFMDYSDETLSYQLERFGGRLFLENDIDGTGLRICVMDAGFPKVNTHPAFQHLRDNNQILMTYNFPSKKEDVYGWSYHGTMVLSCIAGMKGDSKLGLATGAEFLLARTEVDPEPFKEEVWWAQAAEWADKNGADIINSSLGYGKDRHWTREMNGRSYVSKAANMAVEKGILVCNSAGNEGDDSSWMIITAPADAENVLCVGGIEPSLKKYQRIDFSSLGPTADKRLKPNICAFGYATVADPGNGSFTGAYGTSFSSPLAAGFCACAWQTRRDLTALQMKEEIEKSADLYPYFDYAYGFGVPQAAYFTGDLKPSKKSFEFHEDKNGRIHIDFTDLSSEDEVFVNVEGADGVLLSYYKLDRSDMEDNIVINKKALGAGTKLNVSYAGYYDSYPLDGKGIMMNPFRDTDYVVDAQNSTFPKIKQEAWEKTRYFQYEYGLGNDTWNGFNRHFAYGRRWMYGKTYKIGMGLSLDFNRFVCDNQYGILTPLHEKTIMRSMQVRGEVFQRIINRLWGTSWDLGAYGGVNLTRRVKTVDSYTWTNTDGTPLDPQPYDNNKVIGMYYSAKAMNLFQYGLTTRLSYNISSFGSISAYASYRLSNIIVKDDPIIGTATPEPSRWSFGIEIEM